MFNFQLCGEFIKQLHDTLDKGILFDLNKDCVN